MTSSVIWLAFAGTATALVLACLVIRYRIGRMVHRLQYRFEERLAERERVARDLQDDLLQGAEGLVLSLHAASREVEQDAPAHARLERALASADRLVRESRGQALELRVPIDTTQDLPKALAAAGEELASLGSARFRASLEGEPRTMDTAAHDLTYSFGRDMLIHAFRQDGISTVELRLHFGERELRLRLCIDQSDFAKAPQGSRDAAVALGAAVDLWTSLDAGSEVVLRIPADVAYAGSRPWVDWRRLDCLAQVQ